MTQLVQSQSGFVLYDAVCENIGKPAVDSLIQHNAIHLRPTKECSFDLPNQPENQGIVTPESVCGYIAMKHVLDELPKKDKCCINNILNYIQDNNYLAHLLMRYSVISFSAMCYIHQRWQYT